ncbi:MAG: acylphosphatase [bacterium]
MEKHERMELIVNGLVQGVGFRYFVLRNAERLGVKGFTQNLYTGEVLTVAEGERFKLDELFKLIKVGPSHAYVRNFTIAWKSASGEFETFEVKY